MAWVVPLIGIAADILSSGPKARALKEDKQAAFEQERLRNKSAIYQGHSSTPDYSFMTARPAAKGDSGLGSAIQLLGGVLGSKGGGGSSEGYGQALDHATSEGSYDLDSGKGGLLSEWDPLSSDASVDDPDKWKSGISLGDSPFDKWKQGIRL